MLFIVIGYKLVCKHATNTIKLSRNVTFWEKFRTKPFSNEPNFAIICEKKYFCQNASP